MSNWRASSEDRAFAVRQARHDRQYVEHAHARRRRRRQQGSRMSTSETRLVEVGREECLRLLAATEMGRLAVGMAGSAPAIRPVNYVFDESSQSVIFRSARGSKFTALLLAGEAAFEIDGVEPGGPTG